MNIIPRIYISSTDLWNWTRGKKPPRYIQFGQAFLQEALKFHSEMECHYVKSFGVKIIENIFLPFSLGSAALHTSRNGIITASPGTLGLSTYLGFLTGPAVEQI